jgi:hypothetical protein
MLQELKMKFFPLLILTLICFTSLVYAADMPELPMVIQGKAMINEELAEPGTLVSAKLDGEVIKEYTLTQEGDYILTIPNASGILELYIDNIFANKTIEFQSGSIEEINLNVQKEKSSWIYWILILIILILVILLIATLKSKKSKGFKNKKH